MVLYDFWIVSFLAMTVSVYRHCEERSDAFSCEERSRIQKKQQKRYMINNTLFYVKKTEE